MTDLRLIHNPERSRYEAWLDDELAGVADYQLGDRVVVLPHVEVDPAFRGHGIGGQLTRFALDDIAADGTRDVLPLCPFVASWIRLHPDYHGLVREPGSANRR